MRPLLLLLLAGAATGAENPLCDGFIHPLIAEMTDGLKEGCIYAKVVERYVNRTMKGITLYKEDSPEYKTAKTEIKKSLTAVMPNGNSKENRVKVWNLDLTDIYAFEANEINIRGFLLMSWEDDRLAWKYENDIPEDKMKVHYSTSIWIPDVNWRLSKASFIDAGNRDTYLHRNGTVWHHHGFYGRSPCSIDLSDYPNDVQHCCLDFASLSYPDFLKIELMDSARIKITQKIRERYWTVRGEGSLKMLKDPATGNEKMHACFDLARPSATLSYFIILPLASTAVLAVLIPLFTNWKFQISSKFMALLLQFLSLGLTMTDDVRNSTTVPKYLKLYELVIWTTVVSLAVTVILWALSKRRQVLPPPAPLLRLVERVNPLFCGNVPNGGLTKADGSEIQENGLTKMAINTLGDWDKVFIGLNNISLILFTAAYILGIIILMA